MRNRFIKYIEKEALIAEGEKVLLAVSGGVDSMVMAKLFAEAGIPHAIAHCNFMLRDEEAERDEEFVSKYAEENDITLFVKKFDTRQYAADHHLSIQMAARKLRFNWFNNLLMKHGYQLIATGHHRGDQTETFFLNLMRSTGIAGLHGILPKQGNLIHPMLFASREDIEEYASRYDIEYREDSSNMSVKYARNKLRHEVIPLLEEIHSNFQDILTSNIRRIRETEKIYRRRVDEVVNSLLTEKDKMPAISISKLEATDAPTTYLFEYLAQYQFKYSTVEDIINSLQGIPGKAFCSPSHTVIREREFLVIKENEPSEEHEEVIIDRDSVPGYIDRPLRLSFTLLKKDKNFRINPDPRFAFIDMDKLDWPLALSTWKAGEHFFPLGMSSAKKISDFLIDEKVPVYRKQNTRLLRSGKKVVWIPGMRLDHRFRITGDTENILKIKLLEE